MIFWNRIIRNLKITSEKQKGLPNMRDKILVWVELIRMGKDSAGNKRFKRLDMSKSAVRDKVSHAMSNDELDHIFDTDGFIAQ